jgi:nicotinamidase-related amidase
LNRHSDLINTQEALLIIIDVQEKFAKVIGNWDEMVDGILDLIWVCRQLDVPTFGTVHYPKGLGDTTQRIQDALNGDILEKITFSCYQNSAFVERVKSFKRQKIILAGIEAHICILQTAMDLKSAGYQTYVVHDLTASRMKEDLVIAIERMMAHGISVVTKEMLIFELMYQAGTPAFKEIQKRLYQKPKIGFLH